MLLLLHEHGHPLFLFQNLSSYITKKISDVDAILSGITLNDDQRKSLEVLDRLLTGKLKTIKVLDQSVLLLCSVDVIQAEIEDVEKVLE